MKAKYIEDAELEALQGCMSEAEFLPFLVSLETGLRIGDVLKLKPSDVRGGYVYYVAEKTGKAGRAKISRGLQRRLHVPNGSEWIFPGRNGTKPLTRQAAWYRLKRACERVGVNPEGISPHAMRKCFAVETMRAEGAEAARRALQHNDMRTTELYILADWLTGDNAEKPLVRKDIAKIVEEIFKILQMNVDKL